MSAQSQYAKLLKILIIEDNPDDAFLVLHTLKTNFPQSACTHVSSRKELEAYLASNDDPDVILSDWSLPQFNGLAAHEMVRTKGLDIPFIIVSGKIGEEAAIMAIKQGVYDYVLKDNLARLPTAIQHALDYYENEKKSKIHNALIALQATALKVVPAAIAVFNPAGKVEWINPAFTELTGYSSTDLLDTDIGTVCGAATQLPLEKIRLDPASFEDQAFRGIARKKDGSPYFEEGRFSPVIDLDGQLSHMLVIKKDVSASEQQKKGLELDLHLATSLGQAKSPEGLCINALNTLKAQLPEARHGIFLHTDGKSNVEKWFGEEPNRIRTGNGESGPEGDGVFIRDLLLEEEKIARLHVSYPADSAYDQVELLSVVAGRLETALQRMIAQQKISAQLRNISFLKRISHTISRDMDFEMVAVPLLRQIQKFLDGDAIALYLNDKETKNLSCRAHNGFKARLVEEAVIAYGQSNVGIAAEEQRIVSIANFDDIAAGNPFSRLLQAEKFLSQHCAPIVIAGKTTGVLEIFQRRPFTASSEWMILFDAIATQTGLALDYNSIYIDLQQAYLDLELSYEATIEGWSAAMDYRDQETEGHSKRVTSLTVSLASRLGISEEEITRMSRGALLHDVGKIGIPDSILKKPGPLDDAEWLLMKQHPAIAFDMLSPIPYLKDSLDIPLYHHEKWDGSGYPKGLKGEAIPLAARLFSVIDVFDALTSDRPYRKAWNIDETIDYIRKQAGIQFDPELVTAFISMIEE